MTCLPVSRIRKLGPRHASGAGFFLSLVRPALSVPNGPARPVVGQVVADFREQAAPAKLADVLGFRALWVRDVPLNSADYPDPVGHLGPCVFLGALASQTERIVLTLRHPFFLFAKRCRGAVPLPRTRQKLSPSRWPCGRSEISPRGRPVPASIRRAPA